MRRERQWDRVADFFRAGGAAEGTYTLDDRTWADLGLNGIFDAIDRTSTTAGEQVLYANLRRPAITPAALTARKRLVDLLGESPGACATIRRELATLGTSDGDYLADLLWRNDSQLPFSPWVYRGAALLATAMIAVTVFVSVIGGAFGLVAILLFNMWLHGRARLSSESDMQSVRYLSRLLRTAQRLGRSPDMTPSERVILEQVGREARSLRRRLAIQRLLTINVVDEVFGTINVLFLVEARTYAAAFGEIVRLRPLLRRVFEVLGALDCAQSVVAWRRERQEWAEPVLSADEARPMVVDLIHPLVENPVANSIALERGGLVVTGSNMSGKSTFLKAFGVAAVLAQSVATVPARAYASGFLRVRSVMSGSDDLLARKSYYLDEALAVLQTIDSTGQTPAVLCIFDELFRGTNSTERVAAGVSVVRWVAERGSFVLLATHDLQAAALLDGALVNVHFQDEIDEHGIRFDHRLRPGPASRTNALDVLAHVGYPSEIVEQGRRIAVLAGRGDRRPHPDRDTSGALPGYVTGT